MMTAKKYGLTGSTGGIAGKSAGRKQMKNTPMTLSSSSEMALQQFWWTHRQHRSLSHYGNGAYMSARRTTMCWMGIRRMSVLIKRRELLVNERCSGFLDEIGTYIWDEKAAARGEEKPVKQSDHAMDSCRYFCNYLPDWRFE